MKEAFTDIITVLNKLEDLDMTPVQVPNLDISVTSSLITTAPVTGNAATISTFTPGSPEPSMNGEEKESSYFPISENDDGTLDLFGDSELEKEQKGDNQETDYSSQYLHPTPPYTNFDDESPSSPTHPSVSNITVDGDSKKHSLQLQEEEKSSESLDSHTHPPKRVRNEDDSLTFSKTSPVSPSSLKDGASNTVTNDASSKIKSETSESASPSALQALDSTAAGSSKEHSSPHDETVKKEENDKDQYPPMTKEQHKYIHAMLRQLRRGRDSIPFRAPVDPVKQNIPDYPTIIKNPIDLGTMQKKFSSGVYSSAQHFIDDMNLMFSNCFLYNGTESPVGVMGKNLQATFERQLKQLPSAYVTSYSRPGRRPRSMTAPKGGARTRRQAAMYSNSSSGIRETMYDLKPHRRKDAAEMKFCQSVLKELLKKQHEAYAYPFYKPVNPTACGCPDYFKVIKHPMDLGTMQNKLNHNEYASMKAFEADMVLMFKNCYKFNSAGTPVHLMGKKLESVFQKLWANKPDFDSETYMGMSSVNTDYYYGDNEVFDSGDEFLEDDGEEFEAVNRQIHKLQSTLQAMKSRARSSSVSRRSRSRSLSVDIYPPITYEMQNELAEQCNYLSADQLSHVAEILRAALPHLRNTDEIEIDVSAMPPDVFYKVYYYVCKGDEAGAEALATASHTHQEKKKGRALSETEQAEKIRQLRAQLDRFSGIAQNKNTVTGNIAAYNTKSLGSDESSSEDDGESSESSDSA